MRNVMDRDYAGVIMKKLDDVYRTGGAGSAPRSAKESRLAFIVGCPNRRTCSTLIITRRYC